MNTIKTLKELYVQQLRDLYSSETQLVQALPVMAAAATDVTLSLGFERHLDQTRVQAQRIEALFMDLDDVPGGHMCQVMQELIAGSQEIVSHDVPPVVKDAGLIAAAQRIEHHEIAGYGAVVRYAEGLQLTDHALQLRTSEQEERDTDLALTSVAFSVTTKAAQS